jgi:hypothetical protein
LEQKEQVQRVTVAGRFATVDWVAPQFYHHRYGSPDLLDNRTDKQQVLEARSS